MSLLKKVATKFFGQISKATTVSTRPVSFMVFHGVSNEEISCRFECIFNRQDLDGWDLRQAMNDIFALDAVPDPKVVNAALGACRRNNDYSLAVRFLEGCIDRMGSDKEKMYPYFVQEISSTLRELGCDLPEDLGYDKPELFLEDIHNLSLDQKK